MTICNMSIEGGARAGLIAPDDTTFEYLAGRAHAPRAGAAWDKAVAKLAHPPDRRRRDLRQVDRHRRLGPRADGHLRHEPRDGHPDQQPRPGSGGGRGPAGRRALERALEYMDLTPGQAILGQPVDVVFIGSCTNGRISDLRLAAAALKGRQVAPNVRMMIVPGSDEVKREAEREGLHEVFRAAGAEWRESGCSMCIAMNGDQLSPGQYAISTSQPQLRGSPGQGRPDVPRLAADRGRVGGRRRGRGPAAAPRHRGRRRHRGAVR